MDKHGVLAGPVKISWFLNWSHNVMGCRIKSERWLKRYLLFLWTSNARTENPFAHMGSLPCLLGRPHKHWHSTHSLLIKPEFDGCAYPAICCTTFSSFWHLDVVIHFVCFCSFCRYFCGLVSPIIRSWIIPDASLTIFYHILLLRNRVPSCGFGQSLHLLHPQVFAVQSFLDRGACGSALPSPMGQALVLWRELRPT